MFKTQQWIVSFWVWSWNVFLVEPFTPLLVITINNSKDTHHLTCKENSFCRMFPFSSASYTVNCQRLKHSGIPYSCPSREVRGFVIPSL